MTPLALSIMASIQGAIAAAPDILKAAEAARVFIAALFTAKVLTADEQNMLFGGVTALCLARLDGKLPSHWQVRPDPK